MVFVIFLKFPKSLLIWVTDTSRFSLPLLFFCFEPAPRVEQSEEMPVSRRVAENGSNRESSEAACSGPAPRSGTGGYFVRYRLNIFPALENGAAITTVDHADIRGLFTAPWQ